jgi:hypothetical protein
MSQLINGADSMSYLRRKVELEFSFQVPASGAVTVIRDGRGAQVASVSAYTGGLYTVTLKSGIQKPRQITSFQVCISQVDGGTGFNQASYVTDSYSVSAGTFQILATELDGAGGEDQPETGAWISVRLVGPLVDAVKDAA